jgi:hypothetical protein
MSFNRDPCSYANITELRTVAIHMDLVMSFEGTRHVASCAPAARQQSRAKAKGAEYRAAGVLGGLPASRSGSYNPADPRALFACLLAVCGALQSSTAGIQLVAVLACKSFG